MNNFQLYNLAHFIAGKNVYSNWLTPEHFELELISRNLRVMRNKLGLPERYQPGTMQSGASASRVLETDMSMFLKTSEEDITNQETSITDMFYLNDWWTNTSIVAELITQQEVGSRINHPIRKATDQYPFATLISRGLKVWPATTTEVTVSYYRNPTEPAFVTTVNTTTGELEYDESESIEMEWSDSVKLDILNMILQDLGISIERPDLEQYAQKLVEGGK